MKNNLLKKAHPAVCGITEKELTVPRKQLAVTIKKLEKRGMFIIGTSYGKTPTKKIWFIRRGGL